MFLSMLNDDRLTIALVNKGLYKQIRLFNNFKT